MRSRSPILLPYLLALFLIFPAASQAEKSEEDSESKMNAATFSGLELRSIGPALMSGRISDIAIDPRDQSTWYVAVGSGGIFKTHTSGTTWKPIFDNESSYSVGCLTLDPNAPDVVWVGTGENVSGRHVGYGDGVYRSLDGGESWTHMGLEDSVTIGTILVDPRDSKVIYVAAHGNLWAAGGQRGLYKSTDGGENWSKILGGGEYTGVNEVRMDPRDPDVLYASTYQRQRTVAALMGGGPESGIHKSTDGGATWVELTQGLPAGDKGKIGLALSPQNPDVVYATIELGRREGGFWRSDDGGASWEKKNDYVSGATGPHYYQEIFASPHHFDRVYQMDSVMHVTEDGGANFRPVGETDKHVDNHALAFDPNDPDYLLVGTDGGLYETWNLGRNWKFVTNLPVTQFYKLALDNDTPIYNVYGGTQDNNTQGGPTRTLNVHGIRNSDWFITLFGDGHQPATDPSNPDIVYSQWQQGNLVRYDRSSGEIVYIQPQPGPGEEAERWNWDSPILVSPHDPARLFFASQRVWRSDDRGDSWRPISQDLSRGLDRLTLPIMGRVWSIDAAWDLFAMSNYGNVTSLSESPRVEGLIYAGTDDGLIQVTEDGGATWRRAADLPKVPEEAFINDIKADLHDADTVYVALDHHKSGDFRPYLLKSTDRGRSWVSIAGDPEDGGLPDRHLVWRLVQDHEKPELLFAGTEFGVFFSVTGGDRWIELKGGVPQIPFRDLAIQQRESDLVGATFGRGFFVLDDYSPLRQVSEEMLASGETLFPVKDAWWYIPQRPLGGGEKASQGSDFFTAPNPPFGAVITYYLAETSKTRRAERQEKEKEIAKEGGDTPYPGWAALHEEVKEDDPAIVLTVRDARGEIVRHVEGPATAGFHRVAWDLRYPSTAAWSPRASQGFFGAGGGILAPPGEYSVELSRRVDGVTTSLGQKQTFRVAPLGDTVMPRANPDESFRVLRRADLLQGTVDGYSAALDAAREELEAIRQVLGRSTASAALRDEVIALEKKAYDLNLALNGDRMRGGMGIPTAPSLTGRLGNVLFANRFSTYGPTKHHVENLEIAEKQFDAMRPELEALIETELPAVRKKLEAQNVPWTPGRTGR
ncbi:MAG: glycosyl hydrolase [Acidobacteriota bacterium]